MMHFGLKPVGYSVRVKNQMPASFPTPVCPLDLFCLQGFLHSLCCFIPVINVFLMTHFKAPSCLNLSTATSAERGRWREADADCSSELKTPLFLPKLSSSRRGFVLAQLMQLTQLANGLTIFHFFFQRELPGEIQLCVFSEKTHSWALS